MGYELHITRAERWFDAEDHPIGRDEWNTYARQHPAMAEDGWIDWADIGREPTYEWPTIHEDRSSLHWHNGQVWVKGIYTDYLPELAAIAAELGANLIGDDGERYTTDGVVD